MTMTTNTNAAEIRTCAVHGPYEATPHKFLRSAWTGCEACQRERDEREQRRQEECARLELAQRTRQLMSESGIGRRYAEPGFDSYVATTPGQRAALEACRDYAAHFGSGAPGAGIWLIGPPGTGKTHLGCAIVGDVITRHVRSAHIASSRQIIRRLRNTWCPDASETEDDVIRIYGRQALLVLDEVGVGFGTEGEQTQLFDVIDMRYTLQLPTVLLSNLTPALLKATLGERIYDRLREGAKVLVCDWPSHRGSVQ